MILRLAADENFNNDLIRGLIRRKPEIDIVRIQDVGLTGADDPTVLAWAAEEGRVLLTHDVTTITKYAYERVKAGQPMPGAFAVVYGVLPSQAIDDLLLLVECSVDNEWDDRILYLPL